MKEVQVAARKNTTATIENLVSVNYTRKKKSIKKVAKEYGLDKIRVSALRGKILLQKQKRYPDVLENHEKKRR